MSEILLWYVLKYKRSKIRHAEYKLHNSLYFLFLGGFAFLPFLWLVNAIWFFREAFLKPHYDEQSTIRKYVIRSAIGATVWIAGILTWAIFFQVNRASWGETADRISFIIPQGIP